MTDPACLSIPLQDYPGMNRFVLDWMSGDTRFLRRDERSDARAARRRPPPHLVDALIASNRQWGLFVDEQLRRWGRGQTVTLIAGQQVGFAGGPLYTLAKLASLLKMKRELEAAGTPATAFFWMATEDHDFEEVASLSLPMRTGQLDLLRVRASLSVESRAMVGPLPVPETLIAQFLTVFEMPRPQWLREGITFRDSFAELIAAVAGDEIVLVDALLPELRRAGAPLLESIFEKWDEMQRALRYRSGELENSGYVPQVAARDDGMYTLLFEIAHGERTILDRPKSLDPQRVSTSALTRPLLQDFVFQPDVFLGGPAEVAYYAQLAPLHEMLSVPVPRVGLRGHLLVAPRRLLRFIDRLAIRPSEIFSSPDALLAEREPEAVGEIRRLSGEMRRELMEYVSRIADLALPADHSLARAINRSVGHLEYHVNKLAERAVKGVARKDRERYAAARDLVATLYPDGQVQDRIAAWFPLWHEHGSHLMTRFIDEVEPDTASFKVISL
ncbi:MAG TPA: bacillithiol biosynthesis BshC [Thermoanaerobaculia bacterium]|nr:bacillithiol biosynthesis BshC [Thermoanaerobaculia bacterium]